MFVRSGDRYHNLASNVQWRAGVEPLSVNQLVDKKSIKSDKLIMCVPAWTGGTGMFTHVVGGATEDKNKLQQYVPSGRMEGATVYCLFTVFSGVEGLE